MTTLPLVQGVPLDLTITVTGGAAQFPGGHEVKGQVRSSPTSPAVLFDLTPHLTSAVVGADIVVELSLTGVHTRQIDGGVLDVFVADGPAQTAALRVYDARIEVTKAVTRWE